MTATARHARGAADAPVTVEMYGNHECLHCRRAWPAVEALLDELGERVRFVYHHLARPADFPHAELAAEAAEAAAAQGRFWEMHALLMTEAPSLHAETLIASAASLGLDVARVREVRRAREVVVHEAHPLPELVEKRLHRRPRAPTVEALVVPVHLHGHRRVGGAARVAQRREHRHAVNELPHPHPPVAFGLLNANPEACIEVT